MGGTITGTPASGSGTIVQDIIEEALEVINVITDGATPTAAQLALGLARYNSMMQSMGVESNRTWLRETIHVDLIATVAEYNISQAPVTTSRPIRVIHAYRNDGSYDTPLVKISKKEYFDLSDKANAGIPTQYWYDADAPSGILYVWPVPAAADLPQTVYLDVVLQYEDASLADTFDAPAVWKEAAVYQLAVRLAERYGVEVSPTLGALATKALAVAQGQDYDDSSTYTVPSLRGRR